LVILGLMFGFAAALGPTPAAAQGTVCQYNFDEEGNLINSNEVGDCWSLFANSTTCTAADTNGDGAPDSFSGSCVIEQNSYRACMVVDNDGDGNIDSVKGCAPPPATETPVTPTETPVTPTETPVTPTVTETVTETPTATATHDGGKAEPTTPADGGKAQPEETVSALPITGAGDSGGSGVMLATALAAMSVLMFAGAALWARRNAS
jgi:hypothetical protein